MEDWLICDSIGPEEMGRTAQKVELSLSKTPCWLEEMGKRLRTDTESAKCFGEKAGSNHGQANHKDAGTVCGRLERPSFSTFKTVEAECLKFVGAPCAIFGCVKC